MTPEQIQRRNEIFTAEKIIDVSKAIDNEREQYKVIRSLEAKIDSLKHLAKQKDLKIKEYVAENTKLSLAVSDLNNRIIQTQQEETKAAKKLFFGLNLKGRVFSQDFEFKQFGYNFSLSYNLKNIDVGIMHQSLFQESALNNNSFNGIFIQYNFF